MGTGDLNQLYRDAGNLAAMTSLKDLHDKWIKLSNEADRADAGVMDLLVGEIEPG